MGADEAGLYDMYRRWDTEELFLRLQKNLFDGNAERVALAVLADRGIGADRVAHIRSLLAIPSKEPLELRIERLLESHAAGALPPASPVEAIEAAKAEEAATDQGAASVLARSKLAIACSIFAMLIVIVVGQTVARLANIGLGFFPIFLLGLLGAFLTKVLINEICAGEGASAAQKRKSLWGLLAGEVTCYLVLQLIAAGIRGGH